MALLGACRSLPGPICDRRTDVGRSKGGSLPIRRSARPLEVAPGTPCERPLPRAEEAVACRRRSLAQRRSSARARADAVELGFLLVAERAVKLDERGLNGVERPHHRVEALLHRG